jgi:hypothetical protein
MLKLADIMFIGEMLDQRLNITANSIRISVLGANDTTILSIRSIAVTLDNKAVLDLKSAFAVVIPFRYLPCFAR